MEEQKQMKDYIIDYLLDGEDEKHLDPVSSGELLIELGENIHIFQGIRENIKVTTPEDLESLRAIQYYEHYKQFAKEVLKYGL